MTETTATLFVNDDHSRCGACGCDADPAEPAHITLLWTLDKGAGCGARFVALASDLPMTPRLRASLIDMRPDLPILIEPVN